MRTQTNIPKGINRDIKEETQKSIDTNLKTDGH